MECSRLLSIIGLIFNTVASVVLMWPYIVGKHFVDDDLIKDMDMKTGKYHQKKHLAERNNNLWGLGFMGFGFVFQILGLLAN